MTGKLQIYKCEMCGNITQVLHTGVGELVCCGKPMLLMKEGVVDAAVEKHIPVLEKVEGGYKVSVGSVAHPMTEDHLIEWVELVENGKSDPKASLKQFLNSSDTPEAIFTTDSKSVTVRAYCNLHGLWKA